MLAFPNFLILLFPIAALVVTSAGITLVFRYQTPLARSGGILMLVMGIDLASYFFVLTNPPASTIYFRVVLVAHLFFVAAWLFFILAFCGYTRWINRRTVTLIGVLPIVMGVLVLSEPEIDPVWTARNIETIGSIMVFMRDFDWLGPLYIFYMFGIGLFSMSLLIRLVSTTHSEFRTTTVLLLLSMFFIVPSALLEAIGPNPFAPIAVTQLAYTLAGMFSFVFVYRLGAGSILPITRNIAFEYIQDGLLMLDQQGLVVDLNRAAGQIIGRDLKSIAGKSISEVWPQGAHLLTRDSDTSTGENAQTLLDDELGQTVLVQVAPILDINRSIIGRTIVLRNTTGRERMEAILQQQTHDLRRTNELIATLSNVAARVGSASTTQTGFETLGAELRKLNLDCGVVSFDPAGETATIKYLSFSSALIKKAEELTGIRAEGYAIPRQYWPGTRILHEKVPVWYPNPQEYIRRMFPQIPDVLAIKALHALGIGPVSQICILPLIVDEKVIGAMPIWGADLQPADNRVLTLFASQVAGILHSMTTRQNEMKRANELARSNSMIMVLSRVSTLLRNSSNSELVLERLGFEIRGLGLDCGIVTLDPAGEAARIKYLSFDPPLLQKVERLAGVSAKDYLIPRQYWPDDRTIREKKPVWYSDPSDMLRGMFPSVPQYVARKALRVLGFSSETQLCMLPLISQEQTIGAILIWGNELQPADSTVLAIFASQVAGILQNTTAYEVEVERANELSHSNSMILALSQVAARLESSSESTEIFATVGNELKKLGMDSIIGILDEDKLSMKIKYISINQEVIHWAERMTGHPMDELSIPRRLWPTEVVVNEGVPYWDPNMMRGTFNMFPFLPEKLYKVAMKMAGINVNAPVCYLPLANEYDVLGVLGVWGAQLKRSDLSALSVLASQLTTTIRNSKLYENESRRAKELSILLEASEATASSSQLSEILLSLASKLLELSGFESCYISEWAKETNMIRGLIEHSRVNWNAEKQLACSIDDYSSSREVLLTGNPVLLKSGLETEHKQWVDDLGRTAVMVLALKARGRIIGLAELATTKEDHLFDSQILAECQKLLDKAGDTIMEPLSENDPNNLFLIEDTLLKTSGGEICMFWEWDQTEDCILTVSMSADLTWSGKNVKRPEEDLATKLALHEGKASFLVRSKDNRSISVGKNVSMKMDAESTIIFPLQMGNENIGLIELYDFNHQRNAKPEQIALLRTVADKASFSIQNARLLQQTQTRLSEKTALLNEKEVLLKEVHHRVKNNLQIISSLLNLQSSKVTDPETQDTLRESQNRVRTMALIHEKLYQSTDLAQVDFASYLQSLINFLTQSYRGKADNVNIQLSASQITLDIDTAIPCGLIVNELVSNSLKYAFPDDRQGTIWVELSISPEHVFNLRVADDGVGMPPDLDLLTAKSLGLQLVNSLASQVNGKLEMRSTTGVEFCISFRS